MSIVEFPTLKKSKRSDCILNLDIVNDIFNNLKENNFIKNFMEELSKYLENNIANNNKISNDDSSFNNLHLDDLIL